MSDAVAPRRQFRLREADEFFLDRLGLTWETIVEVQLRWLILHDFPLPAGYGRATADIAILIAPAYPPGKLDSAYLYPHLVRADGRVIPNTQGAQIIDKRSWQMWSRHRTGANPWIDGEDDLSSHVHYMQSWFTAEFERAA
jgi:hypothetical protein